LLRGNIRMSLSIVCRRRSDVTAAEGSSGRTQLKNPKTRGKCTAKETALTRRFFCRG
jgi:hypothetical protein